MKKWLLPFCLALAAVASADDDAPRLLPLSGLKFTVERIGTFTYLHCDDPKQPDCALFEQLALQQPEVDWDTLIAKAKKPRKKAVSGPLPILAKSGADDQHGGLWLIALLPPHNGRKAAFLGELTYVVAPDFPGYKITKSDMGQISAEVVLNKAEWQKAVLAQPKKKSGLEKLLE